MLKWGLVLALIMLITGSINTISAKFADLQKTFGVDGCRSFDRSFDHPFFQSILMFIGEAGCLIVFHLSLALSKARGREVEEQAEFKPYIFLLPALCDLTATSMLYVGLSLTYASIAQMMRGSVIIFTGLLARVALGQRFQAHNIYGMAIIVIGLAFVGLSQVFKFPGDPDSLTATDPEARQPILGSVLILAAQLVVACQMIVEQKFISQYNVPSLQVVGWEGVWGLTASLLLNLILYFIPNLAFNIDPVIDDFMSSTVLNRTDPACNATAIKAILNHFENPIDGAYQIAHSWKLVVGSVGLILSIAVFNWSGVSVTSYLNATTRMIIDSLRTIVIWVFGLIVGWESKVAGRIGYELAGFVLLITGTFIYKEIVIAPALRRLDEWWLRRSGGGVGGEFLVDSDRLNASGIQAHRAPAQD